MTKRYIKLLSAPFLFLSAIHADPTIDGPLIQRVNHKYQINPLFSPEIVEELHYLIKRSYSITHRDQDDYGYTNLHQLTTNRINHFRRRSDTSTLSFDLEEASTQDNATHAWYLHRPFTGTHGSNRARGLLRLIPGSNHVEADFVGFTALLQGDETRPPIIAIVFRGSQAQSFQPLSGILGASWLTNFSGRKMAYPSSFGLHHAVFHQGYLERYASARLNIFAHVGDLWRLIPEDQRSQTRIVITGHSQGGGLTIPASIDLVKNLGRELFGEDFDNHVTPRFFIYALSSPNTAGDRGTKQLIHEVVGRDNILCHCSIFDIVTYACPGERYNTLFFGKFLKFFAGIEAGYHPVGHFAFDDPIHLLQSGCYFMGHPISENRLLAAELNLKKAYEAGIKRHQSTCPFRGLKTFKKLFYVSQAIHKLGGLKRFVAINHYGSTTANENCVPQNRVRRCRQLSATFDPRLVETELNHSLYRGMMHRKLVKNYIHYSPEHLDHVFSNISFDLENSVADFELLSESAD